MENQVKKNDMEQLLEIFNNNTIKKIGKFLSLCRSYNCQGVDRIRNSKSEIDLLGIIIETSLSLDMYIDFKSIPKEEIISLSEQDFKDLIVLLNNKNLFEAIKISLELRSLLK
ncbi:MAG: hypothetical protein FH753_11120 [Firmicutes bacterium]|nr:hypothetical protein [Bacillota bacterium]